MGKQKDTSNLTPEALEKYLKIREQNERAKLRRQGVDVPYKRKKANPAEMSEEEYAKWQKSLEYSRRRNEKNRLQKLGIYISTVAEEKRESLKTLAETPATVTVEVPETFAGTLPAPDMYRLTRDQYLITQTYILRWLLDTFTGVLLPENVERHLMGTLRSCDCYLRLSSASDELKVKL